ncbi:hypothetical protein WUBG_08886 [Wuchereria bancrofti]|uniref:Uncharacterized protein n=1 Tax=Wuchereria bancrofti TaxID=6293 RepID=J9ECN9_WUCBA|nr:hypothetical protein WUBG_08886 [Wuchereria bancrofti]
MENSPDETFDPENVKFQYLFDSLRQEFLQQLKEIYQRSCQNRSNLLLLIEWLSISNPILAAKLILERNDVIAKRIDGNLMVSPCKSEGPAIENIEFKGGFITHNYETINSISHQVRDEFFWQEISEEGEKFVEQMEKNLTKLFYR